MNKHYIHKVEKGFVVRCNGVALDEKGKPNSEKPKVFEKDLDARKFIVKLNKPKKK